MNPRKRNLKVSFDRTPEQIDLVKRMGSPNRTDSLAAMEAVAAVMTQPILQVIEQAPVISNLYTTLTFDINTPSTIPLDDYFDVRSRNFLNVFSSSQPGGTATNFVQGATELFVQTYPIESAISLNKNYLRAGNINHLANHLTRLVQEVLLVQETNAAYVLFNSLAGARIDGTSSTATSNLSVTRTQGANVFLMDDFNTLMEMYDNVTASWVGGTPVNQLREITDMLGSPKWMSQIRSIAYQPQNTRNGATTTSGATALAAPESVREQIFRGGGVPTIFDVVLHKVYEMGVGKSYNSVYDTAMGSIGIPGHGEGFGGGNTSAFDGAQEEVIVGLNTEMFDLARLRATEENSEFSLTVDDTFTQRSKKVGYYGGLREGYVSVEGRAKCALVM